MIPVAPFSLGVSMVLCFCVAPMECVGDRLVGGVCSQRMGSVGRGTDSLTTYKWWLKA